MVHGAGAAAQVQHGGQRPGDIGLGPLHGPVQVIALGQVGGDGAGQGAAGAAVSYTHLDVYKRQLLYTFRCAVRASLASPFGRGGRA